MVALELSRNRTLVDPGNLLAAVRGRRERRQTHRHRSGVHPVGEGGRGSGGRVRPVAGALRIDGAEPDSSFGEPCDELAVVVADLVGARLAGAEPTNHARRRGRHGRGGGIVTIPDVDITARLPRVDRRLRCLVGREGAVVIEVVGGQVDQHRDDRMEAGLQIELERRHLDHEHIVRLARGSGEGVADVAARRRVDAARLQARGQHARGRRLAVRAGHRKVRGGRQAGAKLELAPRLEVALPRPGEDLGRRRDAGARHQ